MDGRTNSNDRAESESVSMKTSKFNRAMYLMYHSNHRNYSCDEMQELQTLIKEWRGEYERMTPKKMDAIANYSENSASTEKKQ